MITTERIKLRGVEPIDADFMFDVENDSDAWEYSDTIAPVSRKIIREYALTYNADPFSACQLRLIIAEKDGNSPVGIIDLYEISAVHRRAFVGIYICPGYRNQGYAKEALNGLCSYASKKLRLRKLAAYIAAGNEYSKRLFSSVGFEEEATLKEWLDTTSGQKDVSIFTLNLR